MPFPTRSFTLSMLALAAGACGSTSAGPAMGQFQATWSIVGGACEGMGIAEVRVEVTSGSGATALFDTSHCSSMRSGLVSLLPGVYTVTVVGLDGGGAIVVTAAPAAIEVTANRTATESFVLGGTEVLNTGSLSFTWSLEGESPATGCVKYALKQIRASLLQGGFPVATSSVPCVAATHKMTNLPAGSYTLQLDGYNGNNLPIWGNTLAPSPDVQILPNQGLLLSGAVPLHDLRSALDVTWKMDSGKTCAFAGVAHVGFVVEDGQTKLLDFHTRPDAILPCDLTGVPPAARGLDINGAPSSCGLPTTLQGILLCGFGPSKPYTVHVYGLDAQGVAVKHDKTSLAPLAPHTLSSWDATLKTCAGACR